MTVNCRIGAMTNDHYKLSSFVYSLVFTRSRQGGGGGGEAQEGGGGGRSVDRAQATFVSRSGDHSNQVI